MKVEILNKQKNKITLIISNVRLSIINALRRALISMVPVMAIEDVNFTKNSSPLYDEIIAQRLGLIPLTTDLSYNFISECKCKGKGCSSCQVTLTLSKKGPCTVYSGDLKSEDPKIKPVFDKMPIVLLNENQELEFEAKAVLGTGSEHAKWSSGLAYHRFYPIIKINNKKVTKNSKKVADACPKKVLTFKNGKLSVNTKNEYKCDLCKACEKVANGEITVEGDKNKVIFTYESWGQLPIKDAITTGVEVIQSDLKKLLKLLG